MTKYIRPLFLAACFVLLMIASAFASPLPDFRELAKRDGPAVVNITAERKQPAQKNGPSIFRGAPPFDDFFNMFPFFPEPNPRGNTARGSGFLISNDGFIVTNNHVIENADEVKVTLPDTKTQYTAEVIGTDRDTDLALLKIKADKNLPYLEFGDSDALEVGEWVIAIGNPFGLERSMTAGILSAKGRDIQSGPFDSFLQTDASINPGNSGGPLLNQAGEVIGINTAIIPSGQGIGFAIPSNMAKTVIEQLKIDKKVHRGWLGVQIQPMDEATAKALGRSGTEGALVGEVFPNEPADKAGVKPGDIIIRINNRNIKDTSDLLRTVAQIAPGEKASVTVWRNGKEKTLSLVLGERGNPGAVADKTGTSGQGAMLLGLQLRSVSPDEARALGMPKPEGLLVTGIERGKPAAEAGLISGDVILSANLVPVNSIADLQKIIKEDAQKKGAVMLRVFRRGQIFFKTLTIGK